MLPTAFHCNKKHVYAENFTAYCITYFDLPEFYLISLFHAEYLMHYTSLQYFYPVNMQHSSCRHAFPEWKNILILIRWLHQKPSDLDQQCFSKMGYIWVQQEKG